MIKRNNEIYIPDHEEYEKYLERKEKHKAIIQGYTGAFVFSLLFWLFLGWMIFS